MAKRGRYADVIRELRKDARWAEQTMREGHVCWWDRPTERERIRTLRDAARVLMMEQRKAT